MTNDPAKKPVFLHGLWRSGSTFIWSRFRALPGTYCFYEPLNQGLGRLTAERITRDTADRVEGNRHPELETPYFAEFAPLLKRRGVKGFAPRMAYAPYALRPDDRDPALEAYIRSLTNHAEAQGKQAVLGFNRTGLRMAWLARRFDHSVNVHLDRDPRAVWHSYQRHMEDGHYTYFTAWLMTLERNAALPFFKPLARRLPLRRLPLIKAKSYYRQALDRMSPQDTYFMVFTLWLATTLHALSHADLIIDMERLAAEDAYRKSRVDGLQALCALSPDFSAAKPSDPLPQDRATEQAALAEFPLDAFGDFIDRKNIQRHLDALSQDKADVIRSLLKQCA